MKAEESDQRRVSFEDEIPEKTDLTGKNSEMTTDKEEALGPDNEELGDKSDLKKDDTEMEQDFIGVSDVVVSLTESDSLQT